MKKFASLLLVLVMAMALTAPAWATSGDGQPTTPTEVTTPDGDDDSGAGGAGGAVTSTPAFSASIKLKAGNSANPADFEVYQIFVGDVTAGGNGGGLTNIKWADGVNKKGVVDKLKEEWPEMFASADPDDPEGVAKIIGDNFDRLDDPDAETLADVLGECVDANPTLIPTKESGLAASVMTGWCLIRYTDSSVAGATTENYVQQVTGDVDVAPKTGTSSVTKRVWDPETETWSDAAIYEPDDEIEFQVTVTLPKDLNTYPKTGIILDGNGTEGNTNYWVKIHDTHGTGLTINTGDIKVTVKNPAGDQDLTQADSGSGTFQVVATANGFDIVINNINQLTRAVPGGTIEIRYKGTLNENSVTGTAGNSNKVTMESPTGDDPGEEVKVFELALIIDKQDGDGNPLQGATFTLQKVGLNEQGEPILNDEGVPTDLSPANVTVVASGEGTGTRFTWKGLEQGVYYLTETAPSGYTAMKPVIITIDATGNANLSYPEAGSLTWESTGTRPGASEFTPNGNGDLYAGIKNFSGIVLPSTGGIGTTIFYVLGGLLVVGAIILLVTKRRMSTSEE